MKKSWMLVFAALLLLSSCTAEPKQLSSLSRAEQSPAEVSSAFPESSLPGSAASAFGASSDLEESPASVHLSVPYLSQKDLLPTGCEIVSAMMLLQYYEEPVSLDEMLSHLPCEPLSESNGTLYGPHPDEAFVGNPLTPEGFGCYPPVICRALQEILGDSALVQNTTGSSLQELSTRFLSAGTPVLIWATINMEPSSQGKSWIVRSTGKEFTWRRQEHCLVLTGFDQTYYYLNDPYNGNGKIKVAKKLLEERYQEMGRRSLAVKPLG